LSTDSTGDNDGSPVPWSQRSRLNELLAVLALQAPRSGSTVGEGPILVRFHAVLLVLVVGDGRRVQLLPVGLDRLNPTIYKLVIIFTNDKPLQREHRSGSDADSGCSDWHWSSASQCQRAWPRAINKDIYHLFKSVNKYVPKPGIVGSSAQ
jgi:hypothetical protein